MAVFNKKRMRLIRQKNGSDCALCCMAMLTGIRYRDVVRRVGDCWLMGKGMQNAEVALERLGFANKKIKIPGMRAWRIEYADYKPLRMKPYELSAEYFRDQIWGRRALLSVPSLNNPGGSHMVYWHYDRLYDPSPKKTYKDFKELRPHEIILFMEKK